MKRGPYDTRVLIFGGCDSNVRVRLQQHCSAPSIPVFCSRSKRTRGPPLSIQQWRKGVPSQHSAAIWIQQFLLQACGGGETLKGRARQRRQSTETRGAGARKQLTALAPFSLFSCYPAVGQTLSPILFTLISPVFPFFFALTSTYHIYLHRKPMRGKSNNHRVAVCHHLVCLAHGVINVICRGLCKARICPRVLGRHCYPYVH